MADNPYPEDPGRTGKEGQEARRAAQIVFEYYGIPFGPDTCAHFMVLMKCLQVYASRESAYGGVWKQYGPLSNLLSAARKVDRLMSIFWHRGDQYVGGSARAVEHKDALDDGIDGINYLAFFMRLKTPRGTITGNEPIRPEQSEEKS